MWEFFNLIFSEPALAASLVGGPDLPLGPASLAGREVGGQKKAKAKAKRWVAGTQPVREKKEMRRWQKREMKRE